VAPIAWAADAASWVADQVDTAMHDYRARHGIAQPWETRERVVVALTGGPEGETLIRRAARVAARSAGGDLLAVHRTGEARNGQIVVARVGGPGGDEVTVKRFRKRGREIVLMPENAAFEPIVVDPRATAFAIEGIGVGLVRSGRWQ